jgi:peptide-methionine (S)-S-oxide reductase
MTMPTRAKHLAAALLPLVALAALLLIGAPFGAVEASGRTRAAPSPPPDQDVAIFAGGCFWCMEAPFDRTAGVTSVLSGYAGGRTRGPTYREVGTGRTGHAEAVRVVFDPERVSYEDLLHVYWRNVDPLDAGGQFCDRGTQYRAALFPLDLAQRRAAERSIAAMEERFGRPVATRIERPGTFWVAEDHHQGYYRTHPGEYRAYRQQCGRDARLRQIWGTSGH